MGFFDKFLKSFDDQVSEALEKIKAMNLGVRGLDASVDDKVVTLTGTVPDMKVKARVMEVFNELVDTDNTVNKLTVPRPEPKPEPVEEVPAVAEQPTERLYQVVAGDTLGGIAKQFYGNAGKYMKIFEANRDVLDDPNLIKVGQKLRIPE